MKNHELMLRKRAKEFLNKHPDAGSGPVYEDYHKLIEELHNHQIALEMQNEELQRAHLELEATRDRYVDLYDFAPAGYITVSEKGMILEANLTFSAMLGINRSSLIGKPLSRFITGDTQNDFYLHRLKLFETKAKQTCDLRLIKKDYTPFHARLECALVKDAKENTIQFRAIIADISEQKRAEETLRESEEKYRKIFNTESNSIMLFDAETRHFIDVNDAATSLYGYSHEEFLKLKHRDITAEPEKSDASIGQTLEGDLIRIPVRYHKKKDGTIFPVEISAGKFTLKNRKVLYGVIRDITERKRTEKALHESREKYRMIFENIQDVYYEVGLDGTILEMSPSIEEVSEYSRKELIGASVYKLYAYPEKRDEFMREIFKKGKVTDYEFILKDKNGLHRYCSVYAKLSKNEDGIPEKIIGSICDITRRKQTENALRGSEAQKTALLDAAVDRIRYVDKDMKIIWANKTAVEASGMSQEDLVGKTCYQIFIGRTMPCENCPTLRSRETGRIEKSVMYHPKVKGTRGGSYWDAYCVPLKNEPGTPQSYIQIARNITEQKRAEDQIRTLTQELMKAQESERQMISRELHDRVAQELALVKINCEMLLSHHADIHSEIRQKISEMIRTLQESIKAVRDLSYDLRPPALDEMGLVETLFNYCHDFSENSDISVDFSTAGMKYLKLDFDTEINLYRLVQEGLTNIKKHAAASRVTIRLVAVSPNIILRIEDNGKGFDVQERLANITNEKRMGIRSIQERVKLLQGEMVLQSKPMQGTKIYIKFPYKSRKGDS
jgi:PAS domain S-box-containing protein